MSTSAPPAPATTSRTGATAGPASRRCWWPPDDGRPVMDGAAGPEDVADRLAVVRERLADAAGRAGRPASAVRLVVVTKGVPSPVVQAALDAGATELGENRAQELLAKAPTLRGQPTWHFVGRLQRNKVAALAPVVDLWQSVDRLELGRAIAGRAPGAAVLAE